MPDNDPFAALTVLLDDMDRVGDHPANLSQRLLAPTVRLLAERLRDGIAEARDALGEVTVTEEWGISCLGDIGRRETWRLDDEATARSEVADKIHLACQPRLVRRTVVTTRRVGEWEVAQ